eukprot:g28540.t1
MFKQVDAKVKSALTRELNTGKHAVKVVLPSKSNALNVRVNGNCAFSFDALGRRLVEEPGFDADGEDAEVVMNDVEESEDEEEKSALIKVKGKMAKKPAGKARGKKAKA